MVTDTGAEILDAATVARKCRAVVRLRPREAPVTLTKAAAPQRGFRMVRSRQDAVTCGSALDDDHARRLSCPSGVAGPEKGVVVVILGAEQRAPAAYDAVCERLHTASLRTVVVGPEPRLTAKSVIGILDALRIGGRWWSATAPAAELAWELAATRLGRFAGLVAIDRGHPRVADPNGVVRDDDCPPVEISTTVLVSSPAARAVARDSQRFVYADYRMVDLLGRRSAQESTAQLAAEIVLRTSTW